MMRGHTSLLAERAEHEAEPTNAKERRRLTTPPSVWKTRWPTVVLSTIRAKRICSDRPHATVRRSIARRLVDSAYAIDRSR